MFVSNVLYYSSNHSEAEISVSDGNFTLVCYAHPLERFSINQTVTELYGFDCADIKKADTNDYAVEKISPYFAYQLTAQIVSREKGEVQLGEMHIILDSPIPGDLCSGDFISFSVLRLDFG